MSCNYPTKCSFYYEVGNKQCCCYGKNEDKSTPVNAENCPHFKNEKDVKWKM